MGHSARLRFNETVMLAPYIDSSEMSIVGPPPLTGRRFFLPKKTALGSTLEAEPRAI